MGPLGFRAQHTQTSQPTNQPIIFFHHHQPCVASHVSHPGTHLAICFIIIGHMCGHHVSHFGLIFLSSSDFPSSGFILVIPPCIVAYWGILGHCCISGQCCISEHCCIFGALLHILGALWYILEHCYILGHCLTLGACLTFGCLRDNWVLA